MSPRIIDDHGPTGGEEKRSGLRMSFLHLNRLWNGLPLVVLPLPPDPRPVDVWTTQSETRGQLPTDRTSALTDQGTRQECPLALRDTRLEFRPRLRPTLKRSATE